MQTLPTLPVPVVPASQQYVFVVDENFYSTPLNHLMADNKHILIE